MREIKSAAQVSLDEILGDFDPSEKATQASLKSSVTICVPREYKERFDELQKRSGRRFAKKVRELIKAAIDIAEQKAG